MTSDILATLHARCFLVAPRPWTATEFDEMLAEPRVFFVSEPGGFAVGRLLGPEAELLTLAVDPDRRRKGLGRCLLAAFEREVVARGGTEAVLEVAETNTAGRALYAAAGYVEAGLRRDYYTQAGKRRVSALVLRKSFAPRSR